MFVHDGASGLVACIEAGLCTSCGGSGVGEPMTCAVDKDGNSCYFQSPEFDHTIQEPMDCYVCSGTGKSTKPTGENK